MSLSHPGRLSILPALCALLLGLAACAATHTPTAAQIRTELYFGLSRPTGTLVTPGEWRQFADQDITSAFPDGFTVVDAQGAWRPHGETTPHREPAKILIVLHNGDLKTQEKIEGLRDAYRRRFDQTSVLRVDQKVRTSF